MTPIRLSGEFHGAGLADHGDADLARIGQLLLDLLGDVAGDDLGLDVVHAVRLDHDPDLPAGLHGEHLLHALVGDGDLLQPLQPLDVGLQRLPPGPGPPAADRGGGVGQHGFDGAGLDLVVVGLDRVDDVVSLAVTPGDLGPDQRVAALDLVGQGLADVVQQRAALHQSSVQAQFAGHHPGDVGRLDQVLEHVLAVAGAVPQPPEQRDQLLVHAGEAQLDQGVLAGPGPQLLDPAFPALVAPLDALGVDPPAQAHPLQGQPADLPPHRVEAG